MDNSTLTIILKNIKNLIDEKNEYIKGKIVFSFEGQ